MAALAMPHATKRRKRKGPRTGRVVENKHKGFLRRDGAIDPVRHIQREQPSSD